ncbi:MAG: hypothetical protein ACLSHC_06635 [Bilophila wadsworthia]
MIRKLSALNGIGVWTAEMLMIFRCAVGRAQLGRSGHPAGHGVALQGQELTRERFERRRKRYPHRVVVSLYLWSIAGMEKPWR